MKLEIKKLIQKNEIKNLTLKISREKKIEIKDSFQDRRMKEKKRQKLIYSDL